ncbi:MAG TPA: PAS domain S-box protein [Candidatus Acidoferrales bacterium]|nr:PAS domain S-box protein [Candidatus Acidoferrales bacterium]
MLSSGGFLRIALAVAGLLAAALVLSVSAAPSPEQSHLFSNLIQSLILLWAAVCAFAAARRSSPYFRQLWLLLGAALSLATAGQLGVFYYANILRMPRDTPWPSDVLLFIWVAPAAMMLLPWRWDESSPARWERILDFAQMGIVFVTAYLYFFYVPSLWKSHGMLMFQRLMEAAAARDVLLAAGFLLRSARLPRSPTRAFFARISFFFLALGVAEGIGISSLEEMTRAAAWADAAWTLPFVFVVVLAATWSSPPEPQPTVQASDQSLWVASQILPVTIPLVVIFMGRQIAREQITIAALAIATSFACSAARLLLTSQRQRQIAEDLRRAEHAARQSEQMFSAAFRSSPDAISIAQVPEATILEINESYTRLTGYAREEVLGNTPEGLGLWVDQDFMVALRARFREQGELREEELRFRKKDGQIRYGRLSGSILTLDGRRYSLNVVRDITESKKAEDALRASEERFRTLVRDLQVGVVLVRPDGEMQFGNAAALEMFGLKEEELVGHKASDLAWTPVYEDGTEMPFAMRPVARAIETRQPIRGTVMGWRSRDSGEVFWIIGNAIPQLNQNGEVATVIASFADITDLRKTQEALRSSEERFRSLVQILRVGICTWGPDGRLQFVNQALVDMFGTPKEPILGKKSDEIMAAIHEDGTPIPPELRPSARVIETRRPVRNQVMGWPIAGTKEVIWTLVDAVPEMAPDGRLARVIASLTNITDLKRAEEEKRVSQEMFTKAFQSSPDSMTISTLAGGRYLEVNEGYTRLFGWRREEVVGKTTLELGIWPEPEGRARLEERLLKQGAVHQLEATLRIKSGRLRNFVISADVIELDGQACMLAVSEDITDWKEAERALRYSEERFRTLVQSVDVAVILYAPDETVQFANSAALEMFGVKEADAIGKKASEFGFVLIREDGTVIQPALRPVPRVIATGMAVRNQVIGWRRPGSGEVLWMFGNAVPQFSADGKLATIIVSFANITDQKKTEEALRQLSTRLLQLQDEERRRLGRDLHDSLAQSVLAVNLSLAQVTQGCPALDDRSRQILGDARNMLQDMSREIRTLSYLLHPPLLDELGLASAVKEYAQGFSERSGIRVEVGVSPGFGRLPQETETAFFRIVQESLANIQRHSGSRTARIGLDGKPTGVMLEVSDQGRGIPEASSKKLDEPGTRFGVGIVGMRERMAQLGGTLQIESGKSGTTVRATLPLKTEVLHAATHPRGG